MSDTASAPPADAHLQAALPRLAALPGGVVLDNVLRLRSRRGRRVLASLACPQREAGAYVGFDEGVESSRLNLAAYCDLAYALAVQPLEDGEQEAALAMYRRAKRILGDALPERDQVAHVRLAAHLGDRELLGTLRKTYRRVPETWWRAAEYALDRAEAPDDAGRWLPAFLRFAGWEDLALADSGPEEHLLARLTAAESEPVEDGPLVSVVMTCFRPGPELLTAVDSVLAQSWRRLELLLVDDASEPEYEDVLLEAAGRDERVRLLRQRANGGTYRARNRAMGVAEGEFATGLDSDDWAHPRWIERQIAPLLADPDLVMSVARGIRCTADLEPVVTPAQRLTEPRSTSVLYRAADVRERIGFYDTVLKGGDTEFKLRIQRTFGRDRVAFLDDLLTVVRQRPGSLSEGDVSTGWTTPDRFAYACAFKHWHRRIQQGRSKAFVAAAAPERPFPASRALLVRGAAPERFDLVVAADWRRIDGAGRELLEQAAEAAAGGATVGLVHYVAWEKLNSGLTAIAPQVLSFAAEHGLTFPDLERSSVDKLEAADEALLAGLREDYPLAGTPAEAAKEAEVPEPPAPVPARGPRPRGKDVVLGAAGSCAFALASVFALVSGVSPVTALTVAATGLGAAAAVAAVLIVLVLGRVRR
ncbi:glycosyltransferase family 2 protein [Glycomyces albidus]|uniref:Glycosyltransferase n=1 Tax=Glycomyces albidus TaxID=2656774 RepID=A0A6L5GGY8_9ACTN|nr:glycosyltransferase family 2 protein [Glycomyces albidus]MQM28988.1 glycosyltransferase [Glycomyces albidus]